MVDVSPHHDVHLRSAELDIEWLRSDGAFERERIIESARREAATIEAAARARSDAVLLDTATMAEEWLAEIDDECDRLLASADGHRAAALRADAAVDRAIAGRVRHDAEQDAARLRAGAADDVAALWRTTTSEIEALRRRSDDEITAHWEAAEGELDVARTELVAVRRQAHERAAAIVARAEADAAVLRSQAHDELVAARAAVGRLRHDLDDLVAVVPLPATTTTAPMPTSPMPTSPVPTPIPAPVAATRTRSRGRRLRRFLRPRR